MTDNTNTQMMQVPTTPTGSLLRPFWDCPPDELELAWAAMLIVAVKEYGSAALAQPVQPVPLTDEQIDGIEQMVYTQTLMKSQPQAIYLMKFARAIEAACNTAQPVQPKVTS